MRHTLVRSLVQHFAERAGHQGAIRVFTRLDEFERLRRRRGYEDGPTNAHRDLGSTLPGRLPAVLINVGLHASLAALVRTCAHEAVHVASPDLAHGAEFERRVRRLIRGGSL